MAARAPYGGAVFAARRQAIQQARSQGMGPNRAQAAGRQAAQTTRQTMRQGPQAPPPVPTPGGQGGYYQYTPTAESQINQPYQDLSAAGAYGSLGDVLGRQQQQGQMANIYGGLGAGTLGQYAALQGPNQGIQQGLASEIQGIQGGNLDVDPAMIQQFNQQERDLHAQLQRQLGPDYASSSAGIEALGRFNQGKQTALASANYNRLLGLVNAQQGGMLNLANTGGTLGSLYGGQATDLYNQAMGLRNQQLGGAGQLLGQAGQIQALYGNIPTTMGQFGQAMSGQSGAAVNAQGPYQQDRLTQLGTQYAPTAGQYIGQMLGQSGNRWMQVGNSMMGGASAFQ